MNAIDYLRIYADSDGCSHFETNQIPLETNDYAPPALPLDTSSIESAAKIVFLDLPQGWFGDWHPTPVKQWLILMTGECEFEAGDGNRCVRKAGDVVLLEDTTGPGHRTRVISDVSMRIAAIHLP